MLGWRFDGAVPSFQRLWFGCEPNSRAADCRPPAVQLCQESCRADRSCVAWSAESQDPFVGRISVRTGLRCQHFAAVPPLVSRQISKPGENEPFSCDHPREARECAIGVFGERVR